MDVYQRRRLVALSALAGIFIVFVLLIRSCGGDEEAPVEPIAGATGLGGATVLAQADYISQADAICLDANTLLADVDQADPVEAAADESDIVTSQLQQLQSLPEPDEGTDELNDFLGALEQLAIAYDDRATAVEREDDAAVAEFDAAIDETATEVAEAADAFGLEVCGDPSQVGETETTGGDTDDSTTPSDSGGTAPSDTPIVPETTPPVTDETVVPPADTGGETGAPAPPTDTGDTADDSSSGGVSP